ncbi:MAG: AAA family ATPase [Patescibacteria group bacterium]
MKQFYIGLIGKPGSGKETVANIIKNNVTLGRTVRHHRFSDILYEIANLLYLPKTREVGQKLAVGLRDNIGKDVLSNAVRQRITNDPSDIIILDGIRWWPDVEMLRSFPNNFLLYIVAVPEKRFERLKERKEKAEEASMTWEQFLKEDNAENERFIEEIGKTADPLLNNNGTYIQLKSQIYKMMFVTKLF